MGLRKKAAILCVCAGMMLLGGCGSESKKIFDQAERDLEAGLYEYALEGYRACQAAGTKLPYAFRGEGIASLRMGNYQEAIDSFANALNTGKISKSLEKDILCYKVTAQLYAGLYQEAMAACQALAQGYGMDEDVYFLTGKTALSMDAYDEAARNFEQAFGQDSTYARAIQIYQAYLDKDMEADGTRYLEAALSGQAKTAEDHCDRGRVYYYMEDYVNAKEELTLASNSGNTEAFLLLGMVYMSQKDISNSRVMYQEYVERAVGGGEKAGSSYSAAKGYNGLALCDMAEGNYDSALENISSGISAAKGEELQSLLFNEIVIYEKKLDFATALLKVQSYLEMYPGDEEGEKELAFLKTRVSKEPQQTEEGQQ